MLDCATMKLRRQTMRLRWLLIPAAVVFAFVAGVLASPYVADSVPHFIREDACVEGYAVSAVDGKDLRLFASVGEFDQVDVRGARPRACDIAVIPVHAEGGRLREPCGVPRSDARVAECAGRQ